MVQHTQMAHSNMSYLISRPALPVLAQWAVLFAVLVTKWSLRRRTRTHLKHLSAAQLKDIGLSRQDAHYEATLPFWRP
ncbi:DUF1127 domain-containing protein [Leisingera sp. HS039]|uniref:DUF1127 domain-containing protein n=1 Tax=unclassified Leisingera TaxID=2614906 RepID=UPI001070BA36|nr:MULTISPECIES: DUF1127 domain-containing protein [unclassified Leisingera]MBQ4822995.1 DUF1127 domain-containing protein [Leisingera sp. HS039]MCF6429313.1 DUF1127 domain-containing protein [Leisingera sp. MMG026]QBR36241.1 DUF1127 domain-containing protein [Leisingera sp. NJS201]